MSRILFITSNRLGDAVLSTGVLAHLLGAYPDARTTVVCGPVPAGLFAGVPGLEQVIELPKRKYSLHWWEMWRKCIGKCWDVVVDLRNAPLSYALFSRHQIHLGKANKKHTHRVVALGSLLDLADNPPAPKLWTLPEHEAEAVQMIPEGAPVLALGPTANWIGKTWAAERFVELALRLTDESGILPGARIAVIAHSAEYDMAKPVLAALPKDRTLNLVGEAPLGTVAACLKRSAFYVGNDSGLMHMAAAVGVPTLGLFGPSREEHYAPWGERCAAVRGDKSYDAVFPDDYDYRNTPSLMGDLSVEQAERAARELWSRVS
ncbi:glycosyltransferase family 9 protein [Magnetovibrio sp.]|uniref:glycosyltransferase family 9 protein n=1 Tax=Magnetovibrio sp. TaxID=2024836 RepID=UPI002F959EE0